MSKLSPIPSIPAPRAMISGRTFSLATILSSRAFSTFRSLPRSGRIGLEAAIAALLGRAAGRVALDDVELAAAPGRAPGSRPACRGATRPSRAPLRITRSRALRAASRARAAVRHFSMIRRPSPGFSSRYWPIASATAVWTWPLTSALPSLAFVWPSNCGSVSLTLMTAVRPSRTSSPRQVAVGVLEDAGPACPVVQGARQGGPEPGHVRAAVDRVDVVREGEHVLGVGVVVLEGDLDHRRAVALLAVDRPAGGALPCSGSGAGRRRRARPRSRTTARGRSARR